MKKRGKTICTIAVMLVLYVLIAVGLVYMLYRGGNYPAGTNTLQYIYRAKMLLKGIGEGNGFPLYDPYWFNGEQLLRYVEPLPIYLIAACQALVGGDANTGYLFFVGLLYFAGAVGWIFIGKKIGRLKTGFLVGTLWFFMPNNMHTLFLLGNLAEACAMIFLPVLIGFTYEWFFTEVKKSRTLAGMIVSQFLIVACSVRYSIFVAITVLLFGILVHFMYKKKPGILPAVAAMVLGILLLGVWLYPSLQGDGSDTYNVTVMKNYFQSALQSLNPVYRLQGNDQHYYFGLAAFLLTVFGVLAGSKKSRVGYVAGIILFLGTTSSAYIVLSNMPGKRYFWMTEYISIALCMILLSFVYWKSLKKIFYLACVAVLVIDAYPSIKVNQGQAYYDATDQLDVFEKTTLLDQARQITKQRMYFLDGDIYGASAAYVATVADDGQGIVAQSGGNGWQYAATSENIMDVNEAVGARHYTYLFDRLLLLGNDTVLIYTDATKYLAKDMEDVIAAAKSCGYDLVASKGKYYLFHQDTPETFGVVSRYDAISIGTSGKLLTYSYADMIQGKSNNLNDYSFADLKDYKLVYLSGFTYDDQTSAENLVMKLAKAGVKVVVDASSIPTDTYTGIQEFLGVDCQSVKFENGYPILYYNDQEVLCELFPKDETEWKTVCMNGLTNVKGYLYENGVQMAFAGTAKNENITFIGISLAYHYYRTLDEDGSKKIIDDLIGSYVTKEPDHKIVPLTVDVQNKEVTITSQYDNVNTTLADTDNMLASDDYDINGHQVYVNKGTTTIILYYPYFTQGMLLSAGALVSALLLLIGVRKHGKKQLERG